MKPTLPIKEAKAALEKGESLLKFAQRNDLPYITLRREMMRCGLQTSRQKGVPGRALQDKIARAHLMLQTGSTLVKAALAVGMSYGSLYNHLRLQGLETTFRKYNKNKKESEQ